MIDWMRECDVCEIIRGNAKHCFLMLRMQRGGEGIKQNKQNKEKRGIKTF